MRRARGGAIPILVVSVWGSGCATMRTPPVDDNVTAARWMAQDALAALDAGKVDRAAQLLDQAVAACPDDERVQQHLATALAQSGQLERAISHMQRAVELSRGDARLNCQLGRMHLENADAVAALACARRALGVNHRLAEAWVLEGRALAALHQYPEALASLHRARSLDPAAADVDLDIATVYRQLNQPDRALATLDAAANRYLPGRAPIELVTLHAETLLAIGQPARAADLLTAAVTSDQATIDVWLLLAAAHHARGDWQNEGLVLAAACERFPDATELRQRLAEANATGPNSSEPHWR